MKKNIFSNLAFRYIFEIVVIVFSITISFSLQNYQIKLQNNTVKIRYLKRMLNDLKQDSILIDDAINLTQIRMELNDKFIDGNVSGESLTGCVGYYGLNFNDKSYESFSDLSLLNAIDDDSLFSLMTNYYKKHYEQVRDMEDEERLITIELRNYLFPKLRLLDTERITKVKDISIGEWISDVDGIENDNISRFDWKVNSQSIMILKKDFFLNNQVKYLKTIRGLYILQLKTLMNANKSLKNEIIQSLNGA